MMKLLKQMEINTFYLNKYTSTSVLREVALKLNSKYVVIFTKSENQISLGESALDRFVSIANDTGAVMLYSDYYKIIAGKMVANPLIDYRFGSLRDDFDFGSLLFIRSDVFKMVVSDMAEEYNFGALYDLRLRLSVLGEILHIGEMLYSENEADIRRSGEKQFDYVNPRNREVQIEMEKICTFHLKIIGGYLPSNSEEIDFSEYEDFENEASIIIPVFNRERTIVDAVKSALMQKTNFNFNVIVVDNHSTDKTTSILEEMAENSNSLIHLIPQRGDLGIGGCWNFGINNPKCGRFAVQLDSDDVYSDDKVLQRIVDEFYQQKCAMMVGTYRMTDFNMETLPPGIIDHREWSEENGHNNALRINGLGAPRAFFTPLLRDIGGFPNVSYGEDYAVGLRISREYKIGRIYDVLYCCRRWEGNSDAALDVVKVNINNTYKDMIRSWELKSRVIIGIDGQFE